MVDFMYPSYRRIKDRETKEEIIEIVPKFIAKNSEDLMIRGGRFYAIWLADQNRWSTDEHEAISLMDSILDEYAERKKHRFADSKCVVRHLWDVETGYIDRWHKYCNFQMWDQYNTLDDSLIFANTETVKEDYSSHSLPYALEPGSIDAWDELISVLYTPEERHKIEWSIGSIVTGASKDLQKFIVFYGAAGTGKSTVLNIVEKLFQGYIATFSSKSLGQASNSFALEPFSGNPLVGIDHEGDLSQLDDNTRLNSLVSHDNMVVNEKFKSVYKSRFHCFLMIGTNKPVKITDAKSGLIRRLIDIYPSGNLLGIYDYERLVNQIDFELGAIAWHCKEVFEANPRFYDKYKPTTMLNATNDMYNFIMDSYTEFENEDGTSLKNAWALYKTYSEYAKIQYPMGQRKFREELGNYFNEFKDRHYLDSGERVRCYYKGFKKEIFDKKKGEEQACSNAGLWLTMSNSTTCVFDDMYKDAPAQYANAKGEPFQPWDNVKTTLKDLDTSKCHYVRVPENHIVIDFDLTDQNGEKSLQKNLEAAAQFPPTYAELSKSGKGLHLHYIFSGDPSTLSRVYADKIEIKVPTGKSSLRRQLTKSNGLKIATISSGLPLRAEKNKVAFNGIKSERALRTIIRKCIAKEYQAGTICNVEFMCMVLNDAYDSGLKYDITDMRADIEKFAAGSTHHAAKCLEMVQNVNYKSKPEPRQPFTFFDIEIFPNLFFIGYMYEDSDRFYSLFNPTKEQVKALLDHKLIGFNNRKYDNHLLIRASKGATIKELYDQSNGIIIRKDQSCYEKEAWNAAYTDIYCFSTKKQSLKKWEIEMGILHKELGMKWDQPVPEDKWHLVAEYCENDVRATKDLFYHLKGDYDARMTQVALVKSLHDIYAAPSMTTNNLSKRIIFGANYSPQNEFNYRDLSQPVHSSRYEEYLEKFGADYDFRVFDQNGYPQFRSYVPGEELPEGWSILPFFPGYKFGPAQTIIEPDDPVLLDPDLKKIWLENKPVSKYLGSVIGEGGKVFGAPGMYQNVWDADVSSQHPHSIIFECLFGPRYTKIFSEIVEARVAVKHKDFEKASKLLNGALKPYLTVDNSKALAQALKIVINSIYGLTSASFENEFRDPRNVDNIVAKRGALFMSRLKEEVEKRGYTVAHIKTDSIKIPSAGQDIKDFVIAFGKEYGYSFETEYDFDKFCLVNDAVYAGKTTEGEWVTVGKQFKVPYVKKKLFTREDITLDDLRETASCDTAIYLDFNEDLPDVTYWEQLKDYRTQNANNGKLTKKAQGILAEHADMTDEDVQNEISKGHDLRFVGKVGSFSPVKPGHGGGLLLREDKADDSKYSFVAGSTGYRWVESTDVKMDDIDLDYYNKLVDDAADTIAQYGDLEWFLLDDHLDPISNDRLQF